MYLALIMIFSPRLEKTKKDNKTMSQRLRFYKARSERRGKIVQVNVKAVSFGYIKMRIVRHFGK